MHPQWSEAEKPKEKCYTDIEGGLGWWRDTHFPTTTPKFIMGGVGPNFSVIANGPGYGAGTWEKPRGQYGVAQLSPWLLMPLDGLNLKRQYDSAAVVRCITKDPIAAVSAMADPETPPNIKHEVTVTTPMPPGIKPSQAWAKPTILRPTPPSESNSPANTNKGTAIKMKGSTPPM